MSPYVGKMYLVDNEYHVLIVNDNRTNTPRMLYLNADTHDFVCCLDSKEDMTKWLETQLSSSSTYVVEVCDLVKEFKRIKES